MLVFEIMLKQRTLFVVGAGASFPLNFPTGDTLVQGIAQKLRFQRDYTGNIQADQRLWHAILQLCAETKEDPNAYFDAALEMSEGIGLTDSIDRYVDAHSHNEKFSRLAKLCISLFILDAEFKSIKGCFGDSGNYKAKNLPGNYWISAFCRLHFAGYQQTEISEIFEKVSFLSFNYDRCIRHCLTIGLAKHFRLDDEKAIALASTAQILHPYGSLGPSHSIGNTQLLQYGEIADQNTILRASRNLRTYTEGPESEEFAKSMSTMMLASENIVFLGFGFAGPNLEIMGNVNKQMAPKKVLGTAYKMKAPNLAYLDNMLPQQFRALLGYKLRADLKAEEFLDEFSLDLFR